jgi:cytidine deaminase
MSGSNGGNLITLKAETTALLVEHARAVRERARVPMSNFRVGAALLIKDGRIFTGCNVELANILYSICAERTALVKMVSEGGSEPLAIAVIADADEPIAPCGQCRQALYDFNPEMEVIMATMRSAEVHIEKIGALLPLAYKRPKR